MKKLIDDTDFDDINHLSRRWQKNAEVCVPSSLHDENAKDSQNLIVGKQQFEHAKNNVEDNSFCHSESANNVKTRRSIVPQVIDQDTEQFRNRLEHLLNGFKIDAVSEFMSMKNALLECQKETIRTDTHKYLAMYQEKHRELLQSKDQLINLTSDLQKKSMQIELMSSHIAKLNRKIRVNQSLSQPWNLLYQNALQQKTLRQKLKNAEIFAEKRFKEKTFFAWKNICWDSQKERMSSFTKQTIEAQVKQIAAKFQKQNDVLRMKLGEASRKIEEFQESKHLVQENLKKAFLRGISSMNMEAMGIFGETQMENNSYAHSQERAHYQHTPDSDFRGDLLKNYSRQRESEQYQPSMLKNTTIESKDHKWKEAPIMGYEEKNSFEEPQPHCIKATPESKVIRVVGGKSEVSLHEQIRKEKDGFKKGNRYDSHTKQESAKKKF